MILDTIDYSTIDLLKFFLPKVLYATFCGGVVGLERELKQKVAGIKTNILICVGSTLFSATGCLLAASYHSDPGRVPAQIISGIGFLGAGAIFRSHGKIEGLTTASLIWIVAAIGVLIGTGLGFIACLLILGLLPVTYLLHSIEHKIISYIKERKS